MRRELLIGCGSNRDKRMYVGDHDQWSSLTTLDYNSDHHPDVVHDLEVLPYPFNDNEFDEIHAYHVLEHTGALGDYRFLFAQFTDFHRILKPDGLLFAAVPRWDFMWAFGDPSHKRIINAGTLVFLSQNEYKKQVGITSMSDFRFIYKADFELVFSSNVRDEFQFIIQAK